MIKPSLTALGLVLALGLGQALAQGADAGLCLFTAERIVGGEKVEDQEKRAAHEACLRALAATASIVQKYHLQEADFDIMGTRPKTSP